MSKIEFRDIFIYKKSITYKLKVKNRTSVITNEENGIVIQPKDLEEQVQSLYAEFGKDNLRIFIRASGTEDVLRVHLESHDQQYIDQVKPLIDDYILKHKLIN
jgi:phosphomannomutase